MNVVDLQNILNKYGFDAGAVDGVIGQQTKDATTRFQLAYNVRWLAVDGIPGQDTQNALAELDASQGMLSPHFNYAEVCCRHCGRSGLKRETFAAAEKLRDVAGPIRVFSGYRCRERNEQIRGARDSQHIVGKALDVSMRIDTVMAANAFSGIGTPDGKTAVHIDIRPGDPRHPAIFADVPH